MRHTYGEYARGDVNTNSVEGFFGLFKTGIIGVYHGIGFPYADRYLDEYTFRYNRRKQKDGERMLEAIQNADGRRLTLETPKRRAE